MQTHGVILEKMGYHSDAVYVNDGTRHYFFLSDVGDPHADLSSESSTQGKCKR